MDAPDPARPDRADLYLRLAGHSRTVQTSPVYVTDNPGGKFARHRVGQRIEDAYSLYVERSWRNANFKSR